MANRRSFLQSLTTLPLVGSLFSHTFSNTTLYAAGKPRDYFKELGVNPFINAAGTYTALTASLMQPETVQAIEYASRVFVRLNEVQDAVSARIASLLGA